MVAFFSQWFQTLILVMILASLIEMLLPSRSMERYVRLVLSLTVLMAVLTPVFHLLNSHWLDEGRFREWYERSGIAGAEAPELQQKTDRLLQLQQEQAIDLTEREMETSIAFEVESRFPVDVEHVAVTVEPSPAASETVEVKAIELTVRLTQPADGPPADDAASRGSEGLAVEVQPVDIRISLLASSPEPHSRTPSGDTAVQRRLREWLATNYQLDEQRISVLLTDRR